MTNTDRVGRFARHAAKMFGLRVRDLRLAKGWTQEDLARRMTEAGYGLHQTTIAKLEGNTRPTPVEEVFALAALFGVPISDFFRSDPQPAMDSLVELERVASEIRTELAAATARADELREQLDAAHGLAYSTAKSLLG